MFYYVGTINIWNKIFIVKSGKEDWVGYKRKERRGKKQAKNGQSRRLPKAQNTCMR